MAPCVSETAAISSGRRIGRLELQCCRNALHEKVSRDEQRARLQWLEREGGWCKGLAVYGDVPNWGDANEGIHRPYRKTAPPKMDPTHKMGR